MARSTLTADAVRLAMAEFDRLGRKAFLHEHGFEPSEARLLGRRGKKYDVDAIAAAAYRHVEGGERWIKWGHLTGKMPGAERTLHALGFEFAPISEDPDWTWDEHVLALELYLAHPSSVPGKKSAEVLRLSALLKELGRKMGVAQTGKFRNANGVYMKLMNFRRVDPAVQAAGKAGLSRGAKGEKAVWNAFAHDPPALNVAAQAIRLAIDDEQVHLDQPDDEYEADESNVVLKLHRSRERDRKLIDKKKRQVLAASGSLICEACDFDFGHRYGDHGRNFIEAHHVKPVSTLVKGEKTRLSDLALVCSNCHRMLHRGRSLMSISSLRDVIVR